MLKYLIIALVLLIIVVIYYFGNYDKTYVVSDIDNEKYLVYNNANKQLSANMLGRLNKNMLILINSSRLDSRYYINKLRKRYDPKALVEHMPNLFNRSTAYTFSKGISIGVCLYNNNGMQKFNDLMFVCIHELSHLCIENIGHVDEFWMVFRDLLLEAIKLGIYTPVDYKKHPVNYCDNIDIVYTPLSR